MDKLTGFKWSQEDWERARDLAQRTLLADGHTLWQRVEGMESTWALHEMEHILAKESLDKS